MRFEGNSTAHEAHLASACHMPERTTPHAATRTDGSGEGSAWEQLFLIEEDQSIAGIDDARSARRRATLGILATTVAMLGLLSPAEAKNRTKRRKRKL